MIELLTVVAETDEKVRIGDFALNHFKEYIPSRSAIKKQIKKGAFAVNNEVAASATWVVNGDHVTLYDLEETPPKAYDLLLEVIYEDEFLAVINKPAGISVSGNEYRTIQNAIIGQIIPPETTDALKWPRPVHRLDNPTSGLLVIAKTKAALKELGLLFEKKEIQKTYVALVIGQTAKSGIIEEPVDGLPAKTRYKTIRQIPSLTNSTLSLVELLPVTGRTHQIRRHLSGINHPIMGDTIYRTTGQHIRNKGLFLVAVKLEFVHPITTQFTVIELDLPNKFNVFINRELSRYKKFN